MVPQVWPNRNQRRGRLGHELGQRRQLAHVVEPHHQEDQRAAKQQQPHAQLLEGRARQPGLKRKGRQQRHDEAAVDRYPADIRGRPGVQAAPTWPLHPAAALAQAHYRRHQQGGDGECDQECQSQDSS